MELCDSQIRKWTLPGSKNGTKVERKNEKGLPDCQGFRKIERMSELRGGLGRAKFPDHLVPF